jgi:hypothetical protein
MMLQLTLQACLCCSIGCKPLLAPCTRRLCYPQYFRYQQRQQASGALHRRGPLQESLCTLSR